MRNYCENWNFYVASSPLLFGTHSTAISYLFCCTHLKYRFFPILGVCPWMANENTGDKDVFAVVWVLTSIQYFYVGSELKEMQRLKETFCKTKRSLQLLDTYQLLTICLDLQNGSNEGNRKKLTLEVVLKSWTLFKCPASLAPKAIKQSPQLTRHIGDEPPLIAAWGQLLHR